MPSPNLNANFSKFKASLPSTGFDLSRDFKFTAAPNMYLPVWQHIVNPREKFNINVSANVQCQPIVRPCELTVDQKVDFFFVPMQMMFTAFGNVLYETNDYLTSAGNFEDYTHFSPDSFPLVNLRNTCGIITSWDSAANDEGMEFVDEFGTQKLPVSYFDSEAKGMFRLLMHLGYNPFVIFANWNGQNSYNGQFGRYQPSCFPVFAAAYQAVYQNYYRNDDREKRNLLSYQLDYTFGGGTSRSIFNLRYCQRPKDYFTSLRVSPIMSYLNTRKEGEEDYNNKYDMLTAVNNYLFGYDGMSFEENQKTGLVSNPAASNGYRVQYAMESQEGNSYFKRFNKYASDIVSENDSFEHSINQLRTMFAVERLLRISGRASKNYDSQVLAHLGVKVPHDIKHEISHIGTFYGSFDVQKVVATSNTAYSEGSDDTNLGELAGNGIGVIKGRNLYFDAPCHGVIIGIYSAVPRFSYPLGTMIDKQNLLQRRIDLFTPEFDKLGDQPLFVYEQHVYDNFTSSGTASTPSNQMFLGWQRRYEQYKRKFDVHSLAFAQPYNFDVSVYPNRTVNTWSPWVIGRYPYRNFFVNRVQNVPDEEALIEDITPRGSDFIGSPTDLNDIFVQSYQTQLVEEEQPGSSPWLNFQTDPFMVALKCNVKMVSRMSTTGEPSLNGLGI